MLVGKRKGSHAAGLYAFPGGHLDFGETWTACILRELREECGQNIKVLLRPAIGPYRLDWFTTNDIMPEYGKHYITIFMVADWLEGEAENAEPHKCEGWEWLGLNELMEKNTKGQTANWIPLEEMAHCRNLLGI